MKPTFAAGSPSDPPAVPPLSSVRVEGGVSVGVSASDGESRLETLRQWGGYRLRRERRLSPEGAVDVVLVNSGGGVAGGDRVQLAADLAEGARLRFSATAAEKIYGADPDDAGAEFGEADCARIDCALTVADGARLDWLPQETILYDRARLRRRFDVELAETGEALLLETLVFGRAASGETLATGSIRDRWRVRRAGRLVYADGLTLEDPIDAHLAETAVAAGARAFSTALYVAPDAEDRLDRVREAAAAAPPEIVAGVSAWSGLLSVRLLAPTSALARRFWESALAALSAAPPRAWGC